jgi:hypothetical protein
MMYAKNKKKPNIKFCNSEESVIYHVIKDEDILTIEEIHKRVSVYNAKERKETIKDINKYMSSMLQKGWIEKFG